MEGILASLDWPSHTAWGAFAVFTAIGVIAQSHRHARQAFQQWRLDRRLARDPYILREEMNEHRLAIGDDLDPLTPSNVLKQALLAGAISAFPIWLAEAHLELWWHIAGAAFLGLGFVVGFWRWFNDPDPDPDALTVLGDRYTFHGMAGAVGAVGLAGLLLLLLIWGL